MVASAALIAIALLPKVVALFGSNLTVYQNAMGKLARLWDDPESPTYRYQTAQTLRLLKPDEPWVVEAARRVLEDYGILGPGNAPGSGDWRQREDVRRLPTADREDLELWILERAYRYCRALDEQPSSPDDRRRALETLDRAAGPLRTPALLPLRNRLLAKLDGRDESAPSSTVPDPAHAWRDEHLLGFVAECEEPETTYTTAPTESTGVLQVLETEALKQRQAAERALQHYGGSLALRPDSYWGHYRAAGMCYGLGRFSEAAGHLEQCLQRRPDNPVLLGQLAGCLTALKRHAEALQFCDQALERAPDQAEFYRTRAFIRAKLGPTENLADDVQQFESRRHTGDSPNSPRYPGRLSLEEWPIEVWASQLGIGDHAEKVSPEDIDIRLQLADAFYDAGAFAQAEAELDKILKLDPDNFPARLKRVKLAVQARQYDVARRELDAVLNHPELLEELRKTPINCFTPFFMVTHRYLQAKKVAEARMVAERAYEFAVQLKRDVAKSQYNLAQVYAVMGRSDPQFIRQTAKLLSQAFVARPELRQWYREDRWWLYRIRTRLDAALHQIESSTQVKGRLASASSAKQ